MLEFSVKKLKTILIILMSIVVLSFCWINYQVMGMTQLINEQTQLINEQTQRILEVEEKTVYWQDEINNLYEMNKSHANCVAMAILMNENSVLAETYERSAQEQMKLYGNDKVYVDFYGRLYVPDAKIDVALYVGYSQGICDRQDSANIFSFGTDEGKTIADHSNQEFRKLFSVKVGTEGYIELKNGEIINIVCTDIFNGHNDGVYIVDEEGNNVMDVADYMMYTCRDGWRNVIICLWDRI